MIKEQSMAPFSTWSEEDLKMHKALDDLIAKNIQWSGSTTEVVSMYRCLVWFAQLQPKIKSSIAEITKVYNPAEQKEEAVKRTKAKKAE